MRPSGRIGNAGKIIVDPKAPVIDCIIVDYAAGGACIEVSGQIVLPSRFELLFGGTRKKCRVVWTKGRRFGLSF
jgi:hypothetical protein